MDLTLALRKGGEKEVKKRLSKVFGKRMTKHLLKIMKEGKLDEVYRSAAIVIKQIAEGTYPRDFRQSDLQRDL